MNKDIKKTGDNSGWEEYWGERKNVSGVIYNGIAVFYRKYIIKRTLNHFINKHFRQGASLLHAGCGSGQVDTDIIKRYRLTSLDNSASALKLNKTINKSEGPFVLGDVLDLPFPDSSFDGVYNLGVMEHFTKADIEMILKQFKRVLKPDGKIVLFWPPKFGMTVIFLKIVHFILNRVLRKKKKLHPDEISLIKGKKHITAIMERVGFRLIEKSFSIRDLFTYYIVVCEKTAD